jgi:hypothetical protein
MALPVNRATGREPGVSKPVHGFYKPKVSFGGQRHPRHEELLPTRYLVVLDGIQVPPKLYDRVILPRTVVSVLINTSTRSATGADVG